MTIKEETWEDSKAAAALKRLQENPRVKYIIISVPRDACPACREVAGTYPKDETPPLPIESCSHPLGSRAHYAPFLGELYP